MSRLKGCLDTVALPICVSDGENNFLLVPKAFRARAVTEGVHRHSLLTAEITRNSLYSCAEVSKLGI